MANVKKYTGIVELDGSKIDPDEVIKEKQFIEDLDSLPFPDRELLMDDREFKEMYVTFSRGCPHKCSFCGSYLIQGRKWRHKSVERVLEEIKWYYEKWGTRHFIIEDDNICPPNGIERLKKICEGIIKLKAEKKITGSKFTVSHGFPVYVPADPEVAALLWEAGFRKMSFPLESNDPEVIKDMNKDFTPKLWLKALANWKWEKVKPTQIIIGYPFVETIESMLKTIIAISSQKSVVWASHFRLNKGTPLFKRCLEVGYIDKNYDPINTQAFYI